MQADISKKNSHPKTGSFLLWKQDQPQLLPCWARKTGTMEKGVITDGPEQMLFTIGVDRIKFVIEKLATASRCLSPTLPLLLKNCILLCPIQTNAYINKINQLTIKPISKPLHIYYGQKSVQLFSNSLHNMRYESQNTFSVVCWPKPKLPLKKRKKKTVIIFRPIPFPSSNWSHWTSKVKNVSQNNVRGQQDCNSTCWLEWLMITLDKFLILYQNLRISCGLS